LWAIDPSGIRPLQGSDVIRIVVATLTERQETLIGASLERASHLSADNDVAFACTSVKGRGLRIIEAAAEADVVLFGLKEEVLPGEASHILAAYPRVKIIGVDDCGYARVVLGTVDEPMSRDLPTVIRWITRTSDGLPRREG
jgi:hypothetical protein